MVKPKISYTTTYSAAPPPPRPPPPPPPPFPPPPATYNAFPAPPAPSPPPHLYQDTQGQPPTLLPTTPQLPPPVPTTTSDPMRTTTWGPITYTRKTRRQGQRSDKKKQQKKEKTRSERSREEVTLAGRERSWTWETVQVLPDGQVRKTWITEIEVATEEVVKRVEGGGGEGETKKGNGEEEKTKKGKGKEDSSSEEGIDGDESDGGEEDPIQECAGLVELGGLVGAPGSR